MFYYEAPVRTRVVQCFCAIFWCLLSGGPIFGFAALKPILIKEGIYEEVCKIQIGDINNYSMEAPPSFTSMLLGKAFNIAEEATVPKCTNQDLKLNMMFTVGAVVTNVSALVIGKTLDDFGPRVCGLIGSFFLYVACFIFIFAQNITDSFVGKFFDPYLFGYASMALGGPFAYISSFQLSNSFPKKSGTILALLTGAFDSSSALFLFYRIFYNKSNGSFSLDGFFKLYLLVPVFITIVQLTVMNADSYKTPPDNTLCVDDTPEQSATEHDPLLSGEASEHHASHHRRDSIGDALKQPYAEEGEASLVKHSGGIFGILHGYSAKYQMKSPFFYLMCCFATIQMLRLNYFVATIGTQYAYLFQSLTKAETLTKFFDVALPLGGVLSVPLVGAFLDYCSTVLVLNTLLAVSLVLGILGLIGNYSLGILNVCIFVAYRPFFYTSISDFCAKVFGFDTFGTVYGAIICTSGIFNFSQSILDRLTHTTFQMNPTPINIILICLTVVIGLTTVTYVKVQTKVYNERKQAQLASTSA